MLRGEQIFLGPLVPDDAMVMFRWANDKQLSKLNNAFRPIDLMNHQTYFEGIGRDQSKVMFAIRRAAGAKFVGYVQVTNIHPVFRSADLGIMIGEDEDRGNGYGQEALSLMRDFCWNDLNLSRLTLFVFANNSCAIHVYGKVGFEREGTLRKAWFIDGEYIDIDIMAIVRDR